MAHTTAASTRTGKQQLRLALQLFSGRLCGALGRYNHADIITFDVIHEMRYYMIHDQII